MRKLLIRKIQAPKYDCNREVIRDNNNKIIYEEKQVYIILLLTVYLVNLLKKLAL